MSVVLPRVPARLSHALATAGVALALLSAAPAASAQSVEIMPLLRQGDEFRLQIAHLRENSSRPQQNATATTPVRVRVVSVSPEAAVVEWVPGKSTIDNRTVANDPLMRAASDAMGDLPLRLSLNADREVTGLINESEVVPKLQAGVEVITRDLMAKLPPEQRPGFQALMAQVLSPKVLVAGAMRDAQTFFGLNGAVLEVGEDVEVDIEQPNPIGSGVLPAVFSVKAESATAETFVVTTKTVYDKDAFMTMVKGLLEQAGKPIPQEELAKQPPFDVRDDGRYVFDRKNGLPREIVVSRRVSAGPERRLDRWNIRLVEPPKR